MKKRGKRVFIYNATLFEIILLISIGFSVSFIFSENLVGAFPPFSQSVTAGSGVDSASRLASLEKDVASLKGGAGAVDTSASKGPLEGLKAGVGKVFSGEATLGLSETGVGAYVGTLIGALAWAGVAYAVVQIIGGLLGVDKGVLDAASILEHN